MYQRKTRYCPKCGRRCVRSIFVAKHLVCFHCELCFAAEVAAQ